MKNTPSPVLIGFIPGQTQLISCFGSHGKGIQNSSYGASCQHGCSSLSDCNVNTALVKNTPSPVLIGFIPGQTQLISCFGSHGKGIQNSSYGASCQHGCSSLSDCNVNTALVKNTPSPVLIGFIPGQTQSLVVAVMEKGSKQQLRCLMSK